jgi:hypothetical protein
VGVLERGQSGHNLIEHGPSVSMAVDQWSLLYGLRRAGGAVVTVFLVTLSVFPSLTQHITSTSQGTIHTRACVHHRRNLTEDLCVCVWLCGCVDVSDACGGSASGWVRAFVPLQFLLFNLFDWVRPNITHTLATHSSTYFQRPSCAQTSLLRSII